MAGIEVRNISKQYMVSGNALPVLKDLSILAEDNQITVILGKSGCGKTTLLRIIGQLEHQDRGEVLFTRQPKTAFVFQESRLMPWLSVYKNIVFGLKKEEINEADIAALIESVGLKGFESAYPSQLSGGMQQRVAIARAFAYSPSFILMDEPFAALDHFTRSSMQAELIRIQSNHDCGVLFVTHSIDEALTIAQKIIVIQSGRVAKEYQITEESGQRDLLSDDYINMKVDILKHLGV